MASNSSLRAWLGDPEAQADTRHASLAATRSWQQSDVARRFRAALDACAAHPDRVRASILPLLTDTKWVNELVSEVGEALRANPFVQLPFRPLPNRIGDGALILTHDLASISLITINADRLAEKKAEAEFSARSIRFSGRMSLNAVLRTGDACIQRFVGDTPGPNWTAAEAPPCRAGEIERLIEGSVFEIDGRHESYSFLTAAADIVFIQCDLHVGISPFALEYDARTFALIGATATDQRASRAMMMLSCLSSLGDPNGDAAFEQGLRSPYFYVRWHSLREFMAASPSAAQPWLEWLARKDPHPDIRRAGRNMIARQTATNEPAECRG